MSSADETTTPALSYEKSVKLLKSFGISFVAFASSFGLQVVLPALNQSGFWGALLASLGGFLFNAGLVWSRKNQTTTPESTVNQ